MSLKALVTGTFLSAVPVHGNRYHKGDSRRHSQASLVTFLQESHSPAGARTGKGNFVAEIKNMPCDELLVGVVF